jgi:hypothetical protein
MNTIIGECSKHPGRSMIDCPACAIEGMKKEGIQRNLILFPGINEMCKSHKPKRLSYVQRFNWADAQARNGFLQKQCPNCKRWFFPSEY